MLSIHALTNAHTYFICMQNMLAKIVMMKIHPTIYSDLEE